MSNNINNTLVESDLRLLEHPEIAALDAAAAKLDGQLAEVEATRDEIRSDLAAKVAAVRAAERAEEQARADAVRAAMPAPKTRTAAEVEKAEKAIATLREKLAVAEGSVATHQRALDDQERELDAARVRLTPELREAAVARYHERVARDHRRLVDAVEELATAREAVIVDHGTAPIGLMTLPVTAPNGEQHRWDTVLAAMRQNVDPTIYEAARVPVDQPERVEVVSDIEITAWHLDHGGDLSDPASVARDRYLEQGPRRGDLARQLAARGSQRTWAGVTA
jgi:hypothetical protein